MERMAATAEAAGGGAEGGATDERRMSDGPEEGIAPACRMQGMVVFQPKIRDDRGVKHPLDVERRPPHRGAGTRWPVPSDIAWRTWVANGVYVLVATGTTLWFLNGFTHTAFVAWLIAIFSIGPLGWWARDDNKRLARYWRLCAACGYHLRGLTSEPDGCTLCPECGAAWRLGEEATERRSDEGAEGNDGTLRAGPQRGRGE